MKVLPLCLLTLGFGLLSPATLMAQSADPDCDGAAVDGGIYGFLGGSGCVSAPDPDDIGLPSDITIPSTQEVDDDYDPMDFSGIYLKVHEPRKLQESSLDDGKAYQIGVPNLEVYDKPNGKKIGNISGNSGEVRAKYYYPVNNNDVWVGICGSGRKCGWVSADNIHSLPPGVTQYEVYRVMVPEIFVFAQADVASQKLGSLFEWNHVAVIQSVQNSSGYWSRVCRLEGCGWVASENLSYEY